MVVLECHITILKMWLDGHQWLVDGGEGESFLTLCCVDFPQTIPCENLTVGINLTLAVRKMKNFVFQRVQMYISISMSEHQACR